MGASATDIVLLFVVSVTAGALCRLAERALDRDAREASLREHARAVLLYAAPAFVAAAVFAVIPAGVARADRTRTAEELHSAMVRNVSASEPPAIRF
jgi:hypothetical protein